MQWWVLLPVKKTSARARFQGKADHCNPTENSETVRNTGSKSSDENSKLWLLSSVERDTFNSVFTQKRLWSKLPLPMIPVPRKCGLHGSVVNTPVAVGFVSL